MTDTESFQLWAIWFGIDRSLVGQDTLSREQLIDQLSEGDPHRRKMAEQLLNAPRSFEEGANEHTKKLAKSVG